jgi:hypothetical protein
MFESIISFYQMMVVKNTTECRICENKDQQFLQILGDVKKDVIQMNSKLLVLEKDNSLLKEDNAQMNSKLLVLEKDNSLLMEDNTQMNSKLLVLEKDNSLLKEQCLYPKLENVAIQNFNFEKRIRSLAKCNVVENSEEFIYLGDTSITKTENV